MKCRKCSRQLPEGSSYCCWCGTKQERHHSPRTRGNGMGSVFRLQNGKWRAEVTLGYKNGKRVCRTKSGFTTKRDALSYLPTMYLNKGKPVSSIDDLYKAWSTSAMLKLSESKQCAYRIANNRLDAIRFLKVRDITIETLQTCIDTFGTSFYTKRDMKALLSHLYKRAVAQQEVFTNLAEYIVLPESAEEETVPFDENEVLTLWRVYSDGDVFAGYILLMLYTGMRPGELFKLKKGMISWDENRILGCGTKTKKGKEAPIVYPDFIAPVLHILCDQSQSKVGKVLCMNEDNFYKQFKQLKERCGIRPEVRPYSSRHYTGTALALQNISPSIIMDIMRHTDYATTLNYYTHIPTQTMVDSVNQLPSYTAKPVKSE